MTLPMLAARRSTRLWPVLAGAIIVIANLLLIAPAIYSNVILYAPPDWKIWAEIPARLGSGSLYEAGYRWSPVMAYGWLAVLPIGFVGLVLTHFAVLPLLGWRMALAVLVFWGFWTDVAAGNIFIVVVVVAVLAWRGNRAGEMLYLGLLLLIPRPIQVPLAVWLLWQRPRTRLPFAAMFTAHAVLVWLNGYGPQWIAVLLETSGPQMALPFPINFAPSAFIGWWWMVIGLPLAAVLTARGRIGWASLAVSPYWLPYYPLMLLLEWPESQQWPFDSRLPEAQ